MQWLVNYIEYNKLNACYLKFDVHYLVLVPEKFSDDN
jgi:hypothetical protein